MRHARRWWCVESLFPGDVCHVSAALMFHLISFLATECTPLRQQAFGSTTCSLSGHAVLSKYRLWASAGGLPLCRLYVLLFFFFLKKKNWEEVEGIPVSFCLAPKPLYLSNAFLETSMLRELANHCPVTGRKWSLLFIYNANSEVSPEVW